MSNLSSIADICVPICVLECVDDPARKRSCNNCEKHRDLDARLADARNLVLSLENERIALRTAISEKNDPITTSFPLEITTHIFKFYVSLHAKQNDYFDSRRGFQEIFPAASLTLGAVCRKWRAIAWSNPWLWTTLLVDLLSTGHAHGPELVGQWLERTKGLGVDVRFHTGREGYWMMEGHSEGNAKLIMEILNQFLPQIRCLDLESIPFSLASHLKVLGPATTSKLQRLCLGSGPGYQEEDIESNYQDYSPLFGGGYESPHHPTHIHLSSKIPFDRLGISWDRVTHIEFSRVSRATTFYAIEAAAQSLIHIELDWISDDDTDDIDVNDWLPTLPIQLPLLASLGLGEMDSHVGFTTTVFNSIDAPSLTSLHYEGPGDGEQRPMPLASIFACIQRSSCSIKYLVLNWPDVQDMTEVVVVLRQAPALESLDLTLKSNQSAEPIFLELSHLSEIVATDTWRTRLPNLKKLELNVYKLFDWGMFINIWLARRSTTSGDPSTGSHSTDTLTDIIDAIGIKANAPRKDLSVSMVVRGNLEPSEHYIDSNLLMMLMFLSRDLRGSISVTADGNTARCVAKEEEYDLLERMFLHHFPADSPYLPFLKSMKKTPNL